MWCFFLIDCFFFGLAFRIRGVVSRAVAQQSKARQKTKPASERKGKRKKRRKETRKEKK